MIFDPPPLFEGEEKSYAQLLAEVSRAVMPADFLENVWVRDFVYLTIEILRLRRITRDLITVNAYKGLSEALTPLLGRSQAETLAEGWAARKSDAVAEVNKTLASAGLSTDSILAQTFAIKLDEIERIGQMAALAEARRNLAYMSWSGIAKRWVGDCAVPRSKWRAISSRRKLITRKVE
jgi:hypothetical protein